jgi:predicted metal-dependent HD superfamily phosphohydrolase
VKTKILTCGGNKSKKIIIKMYDSVKLNQMKVESTILQKVEAHVKELFNKRSANEDLYHNISHTMEVIESAKKISELENINESDKEIIIIASWFHDTGYFHCCNGHEEQSSEYARDFLGRESYPAEKTEIVLECIRATKYPQNPKNKLEEIICDADLHHLGMPGIEQRSELLRRELDIKGIKKSDELEWLKISLDFISKHHFFTASAQKEYGFQKNVNLMKIEKRIKKIEKKSKEDELTNIKIELEKHKVEQKHKSEKRSDRGIETMFRNIMRTHVEFSSMADSKANIMISVNTIMISIIVGIMLQFLKDYPIYIIPTLILVLTNIITLVYAILVTRPKVTAGIFTRDEVHQKKSNLLFFGNFYNMKLEDFSWGMKSMMDDQEYLYDSMIKDFYNLGQVLGLKYKHLRMCYTIFMYGIIISLLAFGIIYFLSPSIANLNLFIN